MDPTNVVCSSPEDCARAVYQALHGHHYVLLAGLLLMGACYLVRRLAPLAEAPGRAGKLGAFLRSDRGGAALSLFLAICGGLATAFTAGKGVSLQLVVDALAVSFTASGGWSLARKLLGLSPSSASAAPSP